MFSALHPGTLAVFHKPETRNQPTIRVNFFKQITFSIYGRKTDFVKTKTIPYTTNRRKNCHLILIYGTSHKCNAWKTRACFSCSKPLRRLVPRAFTVFQSSYNRKMRVTPIDLFYRRFTNRFFFFHTNNNTGLIRQCCDSPL